MVARESRDHGKVNWLFEKPGGIQSLGRVSIVVVGECGEHDHWRVRVHETRRGQHLQSTVPVSAESQVGDDQIKWQLLEQRTLRFVQRRGGDGRHVVGGEKINERLPDGNLVFDNQDTFGHGSIRGEDRTAWCGIGNGLSRIVSIGRVRGATAGQQSCAGRTAASDEEASG